MARLEPVGLRAPGRAQDHADAARALIDRAVQGKGGAEKLRSVQTVHAMSDLIVETSAGKVTVPTTLRVRYPGQYRVDSDMPTGPLVQTFDRGTYWVSDSRGVKVLTEDAAEPMRQNVVRDHIALLLALNDGRLLARRAADVTIDGHRMPALTVDLRVSGRLTLVLDGTTGLIVRQRYPARATEGEIEEILSDYRDVRGLQVAFSVTIRHPGDAPITRILRRFDYNVPLDASLFLRPS